MPIVTLRKSSLLLSAVIVITAFQSLYCHAITAESYERQMDRALDSGLQKLNSYPKNPLHFSGNLFFAHGAFVAYFSQDVLIKYAEGLKEAGVDRIDINMGLYPWADSGAKNAADSVAKYDAVVNRIRQMGLTLAINPQYSKSEHPVKNFAEFKAVTLRVYETIAQRYQPDFFVLIHEPTTMSKRMGFSVSPGEWMDFARQAAQVVQRVSPKSVLGLTILPSENEFLPHFLNMREVSRIGIDIYSLRSIKAVGPMIKRIHASGKTSFIEETWRPPYFQFRLGQSLNLESISASSVGNQRFASLDAKWLQFITRYASAMGMDCVTPFWTQTFFAYTTEKEDNAIKAPYNKLVANAISANNRTATFRAYQQLIQEYKSTSPSGGNVLTQPELDFPSGEE